MDENSHPPLIGLRIVELNGRATHSPTRNPQASFAALARPALAAPGIASMTKGSRPNAAHNSSNTAGSHVCRVIRSISACVSSAVIARCRKSSNALDSRR
jgi:hypothetical protein